MNENFLRRPLRIPLESLTDGLARAVTLFRHGREVQAFDLFEQLLETWPQAHVEILALCHDCYMALPGRDRYTLYQRRHFRFPVAEGDRVLDVGSGNVPFPLATDLADLDPDDDGVGRAGQPFKALEGRRVHRCAVESLPFADREFDFVTCCHVLEHSADPARACEELMRVAPRGYLETPSPGKDVFLNTAEISNHLWQVRLWNGTLVFEEYDAQTRRGLKSPVLLDMHTAPTTPREKALAALLWLRAPVVNTMLLWEGRFDYEVRWLRNWAVPQAPQAPAGRIDAAQPRPPAPRPLRLMQVHTFYPQSIQDVYERMPRLAGARFEAQVQALVDDGFSGVHMIAPHLEPLGYEARLVVANNPHAQRRWMADRGLPLPQGEWVRAIARLQIEEFQPDVLYCSDSVTFDGPFVRSLARRPALTLGWRAADIPRGLDWRGIDVLLSSLGPLREFALRIGAGAAEDFSPGVPGALARAAQGVQPDCDVVFCGQFTPGQHRRRGRYLEALGRAAAREGGFTCGLYLSGQTRGLPEHLARWQRPPAYGLAMHRALRTGRIAFDARATHVGYDPQTGMAVDIGGRDTANMRLFEATAAGVFVLTEALDNLGGFFTPGLEIETYSTTRELLDKVRHYLAHPGEREAIAARGRQRCLRDHSMRRKAALFDAIVRRHLGLPAAPEPRAAGQEVAP